jgi:hypothetical protein
MTTPSHRGDPEPVSGWALGGMAFAGSVMLLIGIFQAIAGLVAIFDDNFYVVTRNYTFDIDTTVWGWIQLLIGAAVLACGLGLLSRKTWAGVTVIVLAGLSAVANFFFIPYYPFWSILVIALDVWVIWSVTRPGAIRT